MLKLRARDGAALVVENFIVFRFVQAYLIVSAIALLTTIEFAALIEADNNTDGIYCDYNVAGQPGPGAEGLPEANWSIGATPCRLRIGAIVAEFGPLYLFTLFTIHWPAYMYLMVRHLLYLDRRAGTAETSPRPPFRGERPAVDNVRLFRIVKFYIGISGLLLLTTIGFVTLIGVLFDPGPIYCDYGVAGQPGLDWPMRTKPCQLRVGVFSFRLIFPVLVFLVAMQSPAYLYLIVRHLRARRRGEKGTDPWAWLRNKWRVVRKDALLHIVHVYLVLSAIAVLVWIGMGAAFGVDHNAGATYCNYYVKGYPGLDPEGLPEANWSIAGDPCRLRAWNIFSLYGVLALIFLAAVQSPAYLFLIVRYVFRRRRGALPGV